MIISRDQNTIEIDGNVHEFKPDKVRLDSCGKCSLRGKYRGEHKCSQFPCSAFDREDKQEGYFNLKQ